MAESSELWDAVRKLQVQIKSSNRNIQIAQRTAVRVLANDNHTSRLSKHVERTLMRHG